MQVGSFAPSDVQQISSHIIVNGVKREALSWSIGRSIDSDLPEGVASGTSVSHATGSIEWASLDIGSGSLNPWNPSTGWIPKEGDSVEIWAGDGETSWRQFVGLIDTSSGSIGGGLTSQIIDRIDNLSVRANLPTLVDVMPPISASGDWRRFRLAPRWAISEALRTAGFYTTPAREAHTTVDVPAFGGMWPHLGSLIRCQQGTNVNSAPPFPNGTHVADVNSAYTPRDPRTGNKAVQMTMNIAAGHAGTASLQVIYGPANLILRATATSVMFIIGGQPTIVSVPRTGSIVAQALFKNGVVTLRTSAGQKATGSGTWSASGLMTEVRVAADANSLVNGFIVSHPEESWQEFANINWAPSANIVTGTMHGAMAALLATGDKSVREVLDNASSSLLLPHWIDENGVMQVISSDILRARSSTATITTLDDIRDLSWKRDLLGVRSQVVTSYDTATINRHKDYTVPVWSQGESVVLQAGEDYATVCEPNSGEGWLMVDTALAGVDDTSNINAGIGSWWGGIYTDGVDEAWTNLSGTQLSSTVRELSAGSYEIKQTAATPLSAGWRVELRARSSENSTTTVLWPMWWGTLLPILRAKGTVKTTTKTLDPVSASTQGPVLEHNCGLWATGNTESTETTVPIAIANFIATQVTDPHPTITGLRIGFDPRIQLGDVITISSPNLMGVELSVLIFDKTTSADSSGFSLELGVRVINVTQSFTTYAEWESAWGNVANYAALEAAWLPTSTYEDFNNNPKNGAA